MLRIDPNELELTDRVIHINRNSKVVKGGRRFSFSALVVVGDGKDMLAMDWVKRKRFLRRSARVLNRRKRA